MPSDIWFIYDGECPICTVGARELRIKQEAGILHLLNARENPDHPLMQEIKQRNLDLDEGMVIYWQDRFFHGKDALHVMGVLAGERGWFNWLSRHVFGHPTAAHFLYPFLRCVRNALIKWKKVEPINNLSRK